MSHASGQVKFKDGEVMFFEYNGTSDVYIPTLFRTAEELNDNWRGDHWKECVCGKAEDVLVYTSYGGGWTVPWRACKSCMGMTPGLDYDDSYDTRVNGEPDWSVWKKNPA